MPRNLLTALVIAFAGLSAGSWFLTPATGEKQLRHYAQLIEKDLKLRHQQAQEIVARLDTVFPGLANFGSVKNDSAWNSDLDLATQHPGIFFQLFANDSLLFWNDQKTTIPITLLDSLQQERGPLPAQLSTGQYLFYSRPCSWSATSAFWIIGLPLKEHYRVQSPALPSRFIAGEAIPPDLTLKSAPPGEIIHDFNDQPAFFLQGSLTYASPRNKITGILVLLLGFLGLFKVMEIMALRYSGPHHGLRSLTIFSAIGVAAWLLVRQRVGAAFNAPALVGGTLADYSAGVLLFLGIVLFIYKFFPKNDPPPESPQKKWLQAALSYALVSLAFIGTFWYSRALVHGVDPFFDLNALFPLKTTSLTALFSILFLEIGILLLGWWLLAKVGSYQFSPSLRLSALLGGCVAGMAPTIVIDLGLPLWSIFLTALIFIALLDLLVDFRIRGLTPVVIWLVLLSALTSVLLFKFQLDQDWQRQLRYAEQLAEWRKPEVEPTLRRFSESLRNDEVLQQLEASNQGMPQLLQRLDQHWMAEANLYRSFEYHLEAPSPPQEDLTGRQPIIPITADSLGDGLWYLPPNSYWLKAAIGAPATNELLIAIQPLVRGEGKLLPVFFPAESPDLPPAYDFAVYWEGRLISGRGQPGPELLRAPLPAAGQSRRLLTSERADLIFHDQQGTIVLLSRFLGGYGRPLSLFSFVFVCLLIVAFFFLLVDRLYGALPFSLQSFPFLSLRNRIQVAVLALIIGSFLLVGWVTASFFSKSTTSYRTEQTRNLLYTLKREIQQEPSGSPERIVDHMAGIHHRDIDIFGSDGRLLASSARPLYYLELVAPRIDIRALKRLHQDRDEWIILPNRIGGVAMQTAYLPTRLFGEPVFLGLPLITPTDNARQDIYEFLATLINVYVFLLLLASAIALAVANSITRPLERVGEKLSDLQLESNEPIDWNSPDEIGQLIAAYNGMIRKLAENTEKLRQSEREGAWREMARQVAHEIKTPLTPMKLSIQHLQRASKADPENARPLLDRVANTLIEQIDGLDHIASAFSNFARMPEPKNQEFSLTVLTRSALNFYAHQQTDLPQFSLQLPEQDLMVFADRNQILRVINNLLKNALQAIPEDRPGLIHIKLYPTDHNTACFSVQDNGSGIPEEVQAKVFYPNFTTKSSGMGLGLAMCKRIIETANGKIFFDTEPEIGTTFFFELPLIQAPTEKTSNGLAK